MYLEWSKSGGEELNKVGIFVGIYVSVDHQCDICRNNEWIGDFSEFVSTDLFCSLFSSMYNEPLLDTGRVAISFHYLKKSQLGRL